MPEDKATTCKVGGQTVVFKKKIAPGAKLTASDVKTVDGQPVEKLSPALDKFLAGVAGK